MFIPKCFHFPISVIAPKTLISLTILTHSKLLQGEYIVNCWWANSTSLPAVPSNKIVKMKHYLKNVYQPASESPKKCYYQEPALVTLPTESQAHFFATPYHPPKKMVKCLMITNLKPTTQYISMTDPSVY